MELKEKEYKSHDVVDCNTGELGVVIWLGTKKKEKADLITAEIFSTYAIKKKRRVKKKC